MKSKNLRFYLAVIPLALALTSCGQKSADDEASSSTPAGYSSVPNTNGGSNNNGNNNGGNNGGSGNNSTCSKSVITKPLYSYTVSATGSNSATTPSANIKPDQTLKVQVTPQAGGASTSSGNYQAYELMAMDVQLVANGAEVSGAKVRVPQTGAFYYGGPSKGLVVGTKSSIIDFSSYIQSGKSYTVRIKSVATDWKCKVFCLSNYYCGYTWTGQYVCDMNMINQCKQMNCDVGPANSTQSWNVYLQIETDTTPCL
jgi:hypothetical protein